MSVDYIICITFTIHSVSNLLSIASYYVVYSYHVNLLSAVTFINTPTNSFNHIYASQEAIHVIITALTNYIE